MHWWPLRRDHGNRWRLSLKRHTGGPWLTSRQQHSRLLTVQQEAALGKAALKVRHCAPGTIYWNNAHWALYESLYKAD